MNRNVESHFAQLPQVSISRSRLDRSHDHKTTFNTGSLIPIFVDEVLPGDTFSMDTAMVVRMSTPIHPVMDNAYLDLYYFFVPSRLVWDHFEEFMGANKSGPWTNQATYQIPEQKFGTVASGGAVLANIPSKGSLLDYMGFPIMSMDEARRLVTSGSGHSIGVNALPIRAYCMIWNEWFRDENLQDPIAFSTGDSGIVLRNLPSFNPNGMYAFLQSQNYSSGAYAPAPVAKYHDYFTSALPEPQKGDPVTIPLGDTAPVLAGDFLYVRNNSDNSLVSALDLGTNPGGVLSSTQFGNPGGYTPVHFDGLYADLSQATAATINNLRQAFQLQKLYERDARGGTRYTEILRSHFGVSSPDARLQRPEYLGGKRIPINVSQVLQTSSTDETSPQGNTAAYSLTTDRSSSFTHSFVEHGYLLGLACVRTDHTYQQGLEKFWSRKDRFDFYWPVFANIGEQPIFNKEIYLQFNAQDDEVFGYQEAWADYRYKPNRVSGAFRSSYQTSLDVWHYADYYESLPILGDDWIREDPYNLDRTLSVSWEKEDQFIADFYFKCMCVRPMSVYSFPGLLDHH